MGVKKELEKPPNPKNPQRSRITTLITHFLATSRTPISWLDVLEKIACAPFREKRHIKFTEATKFHRKSGENPTRSQVSKKEKPPNPKNPQRSRITTLITHFLATSRTTNPASMHWRKPRVRLSVKKAHEVHRSHHRKPGGEPQPDHECQNKLEHVT
jgi:hypothetical protein